MLEPVKSTLPKELFLTDLDGTILKGSLVLDHAVFLEEQGIIDTKGLASEWLADKKNEEAIYSLAEMYRYSITGKTEQEILVEDFVNTYYLDPGNYYQGPISELLKARKRKAEVFIISGSPDFLVSKFAEKFNFKARGSFYEKAQDGTFTGFYQNLSGLDAKREIVSEVLPESKKEKVRVSAYGDTFNDLALFEVAERSYLVDPCAETLAKFLSAGLVNSKDRSRVFEIIEPSLSIVPEHAVVYR